MCTRIVAMISIVGSHVKDIMDLLVSRLVDAGKNVRLISDVKELIAFTPKGEDYVVITFAVCSVATLNILKSVGELHLYTNVPFWTGMTRRKHITIVDTNFSAWCIRNMVNEGYNLSAAKQIVASKSVTIPMSVRGFGATKVIRSDLSKIESSVRIGRASMSVITSTACMIDSIFDKDDEIADNIYNDMERKGIL